MRQVSLGVLIASVLVSRPVLAADRTPPSPPGRPSEALLNEDADDDGDGAYPVSWNPARDPESGISLYEVQESHNAGLTWRRLASARSPLARVRRRRHNVRYWYRVRAKNQAGRSSIPRYSDALRLSPRDTTPPTGSILIDDGRSYAIQRSVTLTFIASDNSGTVSQMRCSDDGVTYSSPEPFVPTRTWTLPSGDGQKRVYVRFSDASGNWSEAVSDDITVDTVAPTVTILYPPHGVLLGGS